MVARQRLSELADHKRLLVAQGELRRVLIAVQATRLRDAIPFLDTAERLFRSRRSWVPLAAAGAGVWLAWRGRGFSRIARSALALWPLVRRFVGGKSNPSAPGPLFR